MTSPLIGYPFPFLYANRKRPLAVLSGRLALMLAVSLFAANSSRASDQAQEYIQVRKIALKDPRVQAAYEKANERLNDRILEIDPSLKSYMDKHGTAAGTEQAPKAVAVAPKHEETGRKIVSHPPAATTHIVTKGETLSSIAEHFKVSVASLKAANNIVDDRRLQVGRKLVIPAPKRTSSGGQPHKEQDQGWWDKVKSSF